MRFYQYAGNPSCGCCDNPCPSITITRCNFNEYCNTSGEEWREHDYGTQAVPDKQCELWYTQSASISIDNTKTGKVDNAVWIDGFNAGAWDDKYRGSSQTRADGDTFVITETVTLGSHTIIYSQAHEWVYNSSSATYSDILKVGVYIDGILYWTDELEYRGDPTTLPSYTFNLVLFRRGNSVDVYTSNGNRWVWTFTDVTQNTFAYSFQAVYTGSTKYICVTPNLTWKTVKYKPDPGCVYYPPGTLTQTQINDIEQRQRLSFEDNPACEYTSGILCPIFSPPFSFMLSNRPPEYSADAAVYSPVYVTKYVYQDYVNPVWEVQKRSYCFNSGIARRINLYAEYVEGVRAINNCSDLPYGFTIDYYLYATDAAAVSIITAPANGTASIIEELDGNNEVYIRRIRYTAPSSLPTGTCIDWFEYQLTGKYGETSRGVLKFKLYNADYTQDSMWEDYLFYPTEGIVENAPYYQEVLKLTVEGERTEIGTVYTDEETQWHTELYGLFPHNLKNYTDLTNVTFSYINNVSSWVYQCGNIGESGDTVMSSNPLTPQDTLYQCYLDAKSMMEAITAQFSFRVGKRGAAFNVSSNNILDSCSSRLIDSTTITASVTLKKTNVYNVQTGSGEQGTETLIDTQELQDQTLVVDWGTSPAESPLGLVIPGDQSLTIDVSQYSSRFNINTVNVNVYIRVGQISADTGSSAPLWTGNYQSGTTQDGYAWSSYDYVTAEITTSTSIQYF